LLSAASAFSAINFVFFVECLFNFCISGTALDSFMELQMFLVLQKKGQIEGKQ